MFQPVQAVQAERPSSGLLVSARTPQDGNRWQQGMAWRPERCPTARGFDPCAGSGGFEDPPVGAGDDGVVYYQPMAFRVESVCSTAGFDETQELARVRRQADAATSFMVARELQTGALSTANPYETPASGGVADQVNAYLASADATVEAGVWASDNGVARLEELARRSALGMDVFIHVPISVLPLMETVVVGRTIYTKTGAVIVPDAGYGNIGPDGNPAVGGVWAYATGPVEVRLSDIDVRAIYDHRTNSALVVAERLFAATFDPCNLHALIIDTPTVT